MAAKKFNYVFEDIRRGSTPVSPSGFADLGATEGDELEVDLNEEDTGKAVKRAAAPSEGRTQTQQQRPAKGPQQQRTRDERRREALQSRRATREVVDEAIDAARGEVAEEMGKMRKELTELKGKDELAAAESHYATKKAEIEGKIEEAMEKGRHAEYAKLNSELIELNNDLQRKRLEIKAKATAAPVEGLDGKRPNARPLVRIQRFLKANSDWWADPDHEDAVSFAKKLDKRLIGELNLDPNSDEYWDKFNKGFDKKFPDLRVRDDDDDDGGDDDDELGDEPRGGQRVVAPANRNSGGGGKQQRQQQRQQSDRQPVTAVRLTAEDKANMRMFGLDPGNAEHLVEYARNKIPESEE